ncbi:dephospho-CoA kinase [Proteiniborus ethanoligenes]|uniref:Dephospho-CoA kinase n=2 Tax=Proteiniborus ethanoligenes TaxID=415015 RepID=A0A1H3S3F7_9FIRM|nr:dephospho-CoA kinase [Proteiniborus ethanoligenes]
MIAGMTQNKTKIIGLTGGIGTGKSTVSKIIQEKGFPVIDADLIAREVVNIGEPAYIETVKSFGETILRDDGSIDRKKLGSIVFNDTNLRHRLNSILHPQINKKMKEETFKYSLLYRVVFLDIPLLIEELENLNSSGLLFDEIWLVYADETTQLKRIIERDKTDLADAIRRINAQKSIEEKLKYADVVIYNTGSIKELIDNVNKALEEV